MIKTDLVPLLTIAIPTYNRGEYLSLLLNSIKMQFQGLTNIIEIIVSNNAATDNTTSIVTDYILQGLPIRYLENPINHGFAFNCCQCFNASRGKYLWVLGDDELIVDGALSKIIDLLSTNNYGIIHLSSVGYTDKLPLVKIPSKVQYQIVSNRLEFAKLVNRLFTFISVNIINKQRVLELGFKCDDSAVDFKNALTHLNWIFFALAHAEKFLLIKTRMVITKMNNNIGGYLVFDTFSTLHSRMLHKVMHSYPDVIVAIEVGTIVHLLPLVIYLYRYNKLNNTFQSEDNIECILKKAYAHYHIFWITIYPMLKLPQWLMHLYFYGIRLVAKVSNLLIRMSKLCWKN